MTASALVISMSIAGLAGDVVPQSVVAPAEQAPQTAATSQSLHILTGHSVVIRTEGRLKRIVIGNPAVVSSVTTAPNEIVVSAKQPGSSSIILRQEDGQTRLMEVFVDVDIAPLREALERSFPRENLQVEAQEGKVVLTGTATSAALAEQVAKMAAPFSKEIVNSMQVMPTGRQKQVLIKVRFAEVDRSKLNTFGINLLGTGAANTIGTVTTQQFSAPGLGNQNRLDTQIGAPTRGFTTSMSITDLLNIFVFRPDLNLGATIRDLEQRNVLQILAEPNLMSASGEAAKFLAGGEFPYPVAQVGVGGSTSITIQFRPFGVRLEFTGTIENDNIIRLKVAPEVSSLDFANAVTVAGFIMPAISTRRAETIVELKDGQSFGIAGLLDQRVTAQFSKIPGIADIPILGHLFRSRSTNRATTELMVLVTPSIVDPVTAPAVTPPLPQMPMTPLQQPKFDESLPDGQQEKR